MASIYLCDDYTSSLVLLFLVLEDQLDFSFLHSYGQTQPSLVGGPAKALTRAMEHEED